MVSPSPILPPNPEEETHTSTKKFKVTINGRTYAAKVSKAVAKRDLKTIEKHLVNLLQSENFNRATIKANSISLDNKESALQDAGKLTPLFNEVKRSSEVMYNPENSLLSAFQNFFTRVNLNHRNEQGGADKTETSYRTHSNRVAEVAHKILDLPWIGFRKVVTSLVLRNFSKTTKPGKPIQETKFWSKRNAKIMGRRLFTVALAVSLVAAIVLRLDIVLTAVAIYTVVKSLQAVTNLWSINHVPVIVPEGANADKAKKLITHDLGTLTSGNAEIRRFARSEPGTKHPDKKKIRALSDHLPVQASYQFTNSTGIKTDISVATINSGLGREYMSRMMNDLEEPRRRACWIANQIADWDKEKTAPDVLKFQEVFDSSCAEILEERLKALGYTHFIYPPGQSDTGLNSGLFVASKYPINPKNNHYVPFAQSDAGDSIANKGFLRFTIKVGEEQEIALYNTHLQAQIGDINYTAIRRHQCEEIRDHIKTNTAFLKGNLAGVIVGGDFNMSRRADDLPKKGSDNFTSTPEEESNFQEIFSSVGAFDSYEATHNGEGERTEGPSMYIKAGVNEPQGSWHLGVNQSGEKRKHFMGENWDKVQATVEGCRYDKILFIDPKNLPNYQARKNLKEVNVVLPENTPVQSFLLSSEQAKSIQENPPPVNPTGMKYIFLLNKQSFTDQYPKEVDELLNTPKTFMKEFLKFEAKALRENVEGEEALLPGADDLITVRHLLLLNLPKDTIVKILATPKPKDPRSAEFVAWKKIMDIIVCSRMEIK